MDEIQGFKRAEVYRIKKKRVYYISAVVLAIFIVLFLLSHFKILNLFPFGSKVEEEKPKLNTFIHSNVLKRAEKAGYEAVVTGYEKDNVGRTLFAGPTRRFNGVFDEFGIRTKMFYDGRPAPYQGLLIFHRWETIKDSEDVYVVFVDPQTNNIFKYRILAKNTPVEIDEGNKKLGISETKFYVDNLDYGPKNETKNPLELIGTFSELKPNIRKIIRAGDLFFFKILIKSAEEALSKEGKRERVMVEDKDNIPVIYEFVIRRFEGKKQIEEELSQ